MAYLQKAWTDSIYNPTGIDIDIAIEELQIMDTDHGAFSVATVEEETVLEIQKDLLAILVSNQVERRKKLPGWDEAKSL